MKIFRLAILNLLMAVTACMASENQNAWYGRYEYSATSGETTGGSQIMMAITLELSSHEGKTQCLLSADGYQTYDRIVCSAELANNNMVIKFKSYTDGKVLNPIGVEEYKVGETLFKIKQAPDKSGAGTIRYLTHWEAYTPFGTDRTNLKDYFEKIK